MSKRSEAREKRYMKALKTIAEHTVSIAKKDASEDVRDSDQRLDFDEEFSITLGNYQQDEAQFLDDAYAEALEAAGVSA